ncbi:hypothetical protein Gohar_004908 [Gossypium harknessii]|uniref:Uncharacterized protein n=1 Tax=Gossypium harknessii TaxID=34285 RepID=A0A7J9H6F1_9ROSI|nr:hypothetical protein [Gossypium harknessii]
MAPKKMFPLQFLCSLQTLISTIQQGILEDFGSFAANTAYCQP